MKQAMEGNLPERDMIPGRVSYGNLDMQGPMGGRQHALHLQHPSVNPVIHEGFPLTKRTMQSCDPTITVADFSKGERSKNSATDEDEPSFIEEGFDGHPDASRGKKGSTWQRVKWTDKMVKLLITAVSYIGEDTALDCGSVRRRKHAVLQKKGKWKSVSKVMAERGYHVSPQQCEDKFNDLNKRYKRLNDVIGRGICCQVVENPALLDVIYYLTEKEKDEVRKILSSKHLFYEEMCSYHNGNRLYLPHDRALQRSLQLALRSGADHDINDTRRHSHDDFDEDEQDLDVDEHDEIEENQASHGDEGVYGISGGSAKRMRQGQGLDHKDVTFRNPFQECNKSSLSHPHIAQADMNMLPDSRRSAWSQKQWMDSRSVELEEQKLQIQLEMLELEKQHFKWERFSRKRDHELEKLRMGNERMKLENERMSLDLKNKGMSGDYDR